LWFLHLVTYKLLPMPAYHRGAGEFAGPSYLGQTIPGLNYSIARCAYGPAM